MNKTNRISFEKNAEGMSALAALVAGLNREGVPYELKEGIGCTFVLISTGF